MLLRIAWRNLLARPLQQGLTALAVALGVALALAVLLLAGAFKDGITRAAEPFDMIVGTKGSPNQLVLNTIFLQDVPIGNISWELYRRLESDPRVAEAVPLGLGDNYRGYRLVGASASLFELRSRPGARPYLQIGQGRIFEEEFEAVIGAAAARKLDLKVGDTFTTTHGLAGEGLEEDEHADRPYRVVGILRPAHGPYDQGIFTTLESLWAVHGIEEHGADSEERLEKGVTAVLVKPRSWVGLMQLYREINAGKEAQGVFPGQVLAGLFDLLGQTRRVLEVISGMAMAMAAATVAVSLYWAGVARRRETAVLRALGAGRRSVLALTMLEAVLVTGAGAAAGFLLGHGVSLGIGLWLREQYALSSLPGFNPGEFFILAAVMALGLLSSLMPAVAAYRSEVAPHLEE
ncbi:MAG: ABC transporter permease [Bacillota bacterium]